MSSAGNNQGSTSNQRVAFIGAGNMAEALLRGILKAGLTKSENISVFDPSEERLRLFQTELGVAGVASNKEAVSNASWIFLCTKPQQIGDVLSEIDDSIDPSKQVLVSILAGVSTDKLESQLPAGSRVVRVMPNLPMLIGQGAAGLCGGANAKPEDVTSVETFIQSAAETAVVEEKLMDSVTALSGSGPAYVFYLAEALTAAGVAEGLTEEQARRLTLRTLSGAANMLEATGEEAEELRRRVTSKGGTTEAAVDVLDQLKVKDAWKAAIHAAVERGRELGKS